MSSVQQLLNANPVLVIVALFVIGIVAVLATRILLENAGCLAHLGCTVLIIIVILVLLALIIAR